MSDIVSQVVAWVVLILLAAVTSRYITYALGMFNFRGVGIALIAYLIGLGTVLLVQFSLHRLPSLAFDDLFNWIMVGIVMLITWTLLDMFQWWRGAGWHPRRPFGHQPVATQDGKVT